jgi:hypothetical protein
MNGRLSDPEYELSDEELMELSRQAFADVAQRHQAALKKLHEEIALERERLRKERAAEP